MKGARRLNLGSVLAVFGLSLPGVVFAGQREATIVVQVGNYADIPPKDLANAERVANHVYAAIGVRMIWVHDEGPTDDPQDLRVYLRLLSRDMANRKISTERIAGDVLGHAISPSRCAYVFDHRILSVAMQHGHDYARVLGLVIAHEIGHIVLPTNGHSDVGIMSPNVFLRSKYNLVYFTSGQGEAVRALLTSGGR